MSIGVLNKLWVRAQKGDIDSTITLGLLAAGRPNLGLLVDEFRCGVAGDKSVIASQLKKSKSNPWAKLISSNRDAKNPSSAGLPSLGKRR